MHVFRCLTTRDLVVAAVLFAAFTGAWAAGHQGFIGWTSFILVPLVLAAGRRAR